MSYMETNSRIYNYAWLARREIWCLPRVVSCEPRCASFSPHAKADLPSRSAKPICHKCLSPHPMLWFESNCVQLRCKARETCSRARGDCPSRDSVPDRSAAAGQTRSQQQSLPSKLHFVRMQPQ